MDKLIPMRVDGRVIPYTKDGFPEFIPLVEALCRGDANDVEQICDHFSTYPYVDDLHRIVREASNVTGRTRANLWKSIDMGVDIPRTATHPKKRLTFLDEGDDEDGDDYVDYYAREEEEDDVENLSSSEESDEGSVYDDEGEHDRHLNDEEQPFNMDRNTAIQTVHAMGTLLRGLGAEDAHARARITNLALRAVDCVFPEMPTRAQYGVSERARMLGIDLKDVSVYNVGKRALELFQNKNGGRRPSQRSVHDEEYDRTYMMNVYTDAQARDTLDVALRETVRGNNKKKRRIGQ